MDFHEHLICQRGLVAPLASFCGRTQQMPSRSWRTFRYDVLEFCHSVRLDKVLEPEQYGAAHVTELGLVVETNLEAKWPSV